MRAAALGVLKLIPGLSSERAIRAIRRDTPGVPTLEEFWRLPVADLASVHPGVAASPG